MSPDSLILILMTFVGAFVNGALGYGFSSVTVPVALLFYTNKTLNPALVIVEVILNGHVLFIHRKSLPNIWRRVFPIFWGLVPAIFVGSYVLSYVRPEFLKMFTYVVLIPLILCQAAGIRRPIRSEKRFLSPLGVGVGLLYSLTTISGPPLALFLNNQGFSKNDFKAALGLIRFVQAILTAVAYLYLGLYKEMHLSLSLLILPGILLGVPLGASVVRNIGTETFRRIAMSFDSWIVVFGLARLWVSLHIFPAKIAYGMMAIVMSVDGYLLVHYFKGKRKKESVSADVPALFGQAPD